MPSTLVPAALVIKMIVQWMRLPTLHGIPAGRKRKWVRAIGQANIGNLAIKMSKGAMDFEQYRAIAWRSLLLYGRRWQSLPTGA